MSTAEETKQMPPFPKNTHTLSVTLMRILNHPSSPSDHSETLTWETHSEESSPADTPEHLNALNPTHTHTLTTTRWQRIWAREKERGGNRDWLMKPLSKPPSNPSQAFTMALLLQPPRSNTQSKVRSHTVLHNKLLHDSTQKNLKIFWRAPRE